MWILMLVMMVFTRKRHEEDSQIPTNQSVSKGSGYVCAKRRRKNKSLNIAEQPVAVEQQIAFEGQAVAKQPSTELPAELAATEQPADPRRRHGPNINHRVARSLQNLPEGTKIPLTMDKETKTFVGTLATHFATECGIIIRNVCPMNFHTWHSVPSDVKTLMYEKLEENIIEHKKSVANKLTLKRTVITTAIEHNLEKEAIQSVCGNQKTLQFARENVNAY
ncbi:hypothetical protein R6Q59_006097 [Mikania micrantha]